jgi:hypothetical protein
MNKQSMPAVQSERGNSLDSHSAITAVEHDATVIAAEIDVHQFSREHIVTRAGAAVGGREMRFRTHRGLLLE